MEDYLISEKGNFLIFKSNEHILFITPDIQVHPWLIRYGNQYVFNGRVYYPYIYNPQLKFKNDCLQFAESLTLNVDGYEGAACILKEKTSNRVFGFNDERNIEVASQLGNKLNQYADPEIGESYAIVRHKVKVGKAPYHIAYVMFKDGLDNITIEADAGDLKRNHPVFDMYSVRYIDKTFHKRYIEDYTPGSTIVLKKKK
jgi:hypothetical protein